MVYSFLCPQEQGLCVFFLCLHGSLPSASKNEAPVCVCVYRCCEHGLHELLCASRTSHLCVCMCMRVCVYLVCVLRLLGAWVCICPSLLPSAAARRARPLCCVQRLFWPSAWCLHPRPPPLCPQRLCRSQQPALPRLLAQRALSVRPRLRAGASCFSVLLCSVVPSSSKARRRPLQRMMRTTHQVSPPILSPHLSRLAHCPICPVWPIGPAHVDRVRAALKICSRYPTFVLDTFYTLMHVPPMALTRTRCCRWPREHSSHGDVQGQGRCVRQASNVEAVQKEGDRGGRWRRWTRRKFQGRTRHPIQWPQGAGFGCGQGQYSEIGRLLHCALQSLL